MWIYSRVKMRVFVKEGEREIYVADWKLWVYVKEQVPTSPYMPVCLYSHSPKLQNVSILILALKKDIVLKVNVSKTETYF